MTSFERAARYAVATPGAVSGAGGHASTFALAMNLVHGFQLPPSEALQLLADWNSKCSPPWALAELAHKIQSAAQARPAKAPGWLLGASGDWKPANHHPPAPRAFSLPSDLRPLSASEQTQLASLRSLAPEALAMATQIGLLWFGTVKGNSCWLITDARRVAAQARRLNGQFFVKADGSACKAHTLAGSKASWPIGAASLGERPVVALCEGGPDLLSAFHFAWCENRDDVAPVCMLGASQRIAPEALPLFKKRRIRIFTHSDTAGRTAAHRWATQLREAGAIADGFKFDGLTRTDGHPVSDLNDLASVSPDNFEQHRILWKILP